ncbi:hypothetical protein BDV40DRAFT_277338 [Aspergillus tamarii]|uniref:Uncharacterized protein n=1 Tax=Aspergillus tamarii TaxID=41984 RepID=A0A5N6UGS8_ASPTM|nr:hypothetical protein BDV40DRAFT_277338 [Aspergillus tamarii]
MKPRLSILTSKANARCSLRGEERILWFSYSILFYFFDLAFSPKEGEKTLQVCFLLQFSSPLVHYRSHVEGKGLHLSWPV